VHCCTLRTCVTCTFALVLTPCHINIKSSYHKHFHRLQEQEVVVQSAQTTADIANEKAQSTIEKLRCLACCCDESLHYLCVNRASNITSCFTLTMSTMYTLVYIILCLLSILLLSHNTSALQSQLDLKINELSAVREVQYNMIIHHAVLSTAS
jgi:hypothetical protein